MTELSGGFERLATMSDLITARVIAARLQSDGIEVRLHGESMGPYRLTVGTWALTELWVPSDRLEEARQVMLETEVADALGDVPEADTAEVGDEGEEPSTPVGVLMVIAFVMAAALVARLVVLLL